MAGQTPAKIAEIVKAELIDAKLLSQRLFEAHWHHTAFAST